MTEQDKGGQMDGAEGAQSGKNLHCIGALTACQVLVVLKIVLSMV